MAISISLEGAELLEVFQWSRDDVWCKAKMENMREELADVLIYGIMMADTCGRSIKHCGVLISYPSVYIAEINSRKW
ncbi:MAG TPA: hypothetical protein H9717_16950 [Candidatus Eisenbergiella merdipullorum]|uniref:Uncharacterized protein n=1 Tax=Candidatus Eisenbergiella merdipullorum TaxID=2838553 RepID=A0A9D2I9V9_9FIRM|nr:hypothetical protein [Candidatus Eisenbergiella merdipullorum]